MGYIGAGLTRFNTADELTVTGNAEFNGNATFGTVTADGLTVDTNTLHVDSTNNSVGIGTASPTKKVSASIGLNDTDGYVLEYLGDAKGGILLNPIGGEVRVGAINSSGTYFTTFYSNATERMRIDSSGNVGIGTSSPSNFAGYTTLDVVNSTNGGAILARGSTVEARFISDEPTGTVQVKAQSSHPLTFGTGGTERMRIDASGNVAMLNHASIGVNAPASTRALTVAGATDGSGSSILVCYNSSLAQKFAVRDDGYITATGDIQVGGGVYLGGTGAANHLDDYEEGTWTPASGGGTGPTGSGSYIKIGRSVTVMADVTFTGVTSPTHLITGLPFPANGVQTGACIAWNNSSRYLNLLIPTGASNLSLGNQQSTIENVNNNNRLIFSLTYQT